MPSAEIIAIGTELLLGEIQDTNTRYLARLLRDYGVDLYRTMIVGDNVDRIAYAVRESLTRCQIILTTGGLGPTVDDPTRQAIAQAVGVELEFQSQLWDQIQNRFIRYGRIPTENNKRQAFIPKGATPLENPVGTAPAFIVETETQAIISLPGVPREMEHITQYTVLPYLKKKFNLQGTIKACVLHVAGVGESQVDEWIMDLETQPNPTVGLLAHPGLIDIRITAKADSLEKADQMIATMVLEIEKRVGNNIYGKDDEMIEQVIGRTLADRGWHLKLVEFNLLGQVTQRLKRANVPLTDYVSSSDILDLTALKEKLATINKENDEITYGIAFAPGLVKQSLNLFLSTPAGEYEASRAYGGPPDHGPLWAINTALDFLRRNI
jgi:nicotinamide-nucleotide amidase